jgi:hypothetical protein
MQKVRDASESLSRKRQRTRRARVHADGSINPPPKSTTSLPPKSIILLQLK